MDEMKDSIHKYDPDSLEGDFDWEIDDDVVLTPPPPKEQYRVTCKVVKIEKIQ